MTIYRLRVQFDGADDVPHGGYKSSGFGREGRTGSHGELHAVQVGLDRPVLTATHKAPQSVQEGKS